MAEKKKVAKKKVSIGKKLKTNPWILGTLFFGLLSIVLIFVITSGGISEDRAGQVVLDIAQQQLGDSVTLKNVVPYEDNFYLVTLAFQDQESDIYITKDGSNLIGGITPVASLVEPSEAPKEPAPVDVEKTDRPLAQLFVMTHCPYGTQAEKGFLPIARLLKDVADVEIRFVHYTMHGEKEDAETRRQVCIREEQNDKYLDYLECFLRGDGNVVNGYVSEGNDPSTCMKEAGVDESKVIDCIDSGRGEEYYAEDSALSQAAGVQGSPTLVVNGAIVQSGRSEANYLAQICAASTNPSEKCATEVSTDTPGVYFGWDATSNVGEGNICG